MSLGMKRKNLKLCLKISSGYPRFVRHSKIHELSEFWKTLDQALKTLIIYFFPNLSDFTFCQKVCDISNDDIDEDEELSDS